MSIILNYLDSFSFAISVSKFIVVFFSFFILLFIGGIVCESTKKYSLFFIFALIWLSIFGSIVYSEINKYKMNSILANENLKFSGDEKLYEVIPDKSVNNLVVKSNYRVIGHIDCSLSWRECAELIIKNKSKLVSDNFKQSESFVLNK